jgi:hypothetical protein
MLSSYRSDPLGRRGGGGGSKAKCMSDEVPLLDRRHHPTNRSVIDVKTKDHGNVCSVTVISSDGRSNVWGSGHHRSMSAINLATSISGRP